jgi:hypothetical protein
MKISQILVGMAAAVTLSGCVDLSSPSRTLSTAYGAVKKEKLSDFRKTLEGDALVRHVNAEGMAALKEKIDSVSDVAVGRQIVLSDRNGQRLSEVQVLAKFQGTGQVGELLSAHVNCAYWTEYQPGRCFTTCAPYGGSCHTTCEPGYQREVQSCRIAKIQ